MPLENNQSSTFFVPPPTSSISPTLSLSLSLSCPHSDPNPAPGVDSYLQGVASLRDALSSIAIVVDDLVAQGLKVVAQLTFKASMGG